MCKASCQKSLQENLTIDRSKDTGQQMFYLFAAFVKFESNLIQERSAAGQVAAKVRGSREIWIEDIEMMRSLIDGGHTHSSKMWQIARDFLEQQFIVIWNISNLIS